MSHQLVTRCLLPGSSRVKRQNDCEHICDIQRSQNYPSVQGKRVTPLRWGTVGGPPAGACGGQGGLGFKRKYHGTIVRIQISHLWCFHKQRWTVNRAMARRPAAISVHVLRPRSVQRPNSRCLATAAAGLRGDAHPERPFPPTTPVDNEQIAQLAAKPLHTLTLADLVRFAN